MSALSLIWKRIRNHLQSNKFASGMTLIEITIVVTISTLVMAGAIVGGMALQKRSQISETKKAVFQISQDLLTWQNEHPGKSSCGFGSLDSLFQQKILSASPKDKWGMPIQVRCPGEHSDAVDVWSYGPDKKDGTEDDIRSWDN